MSLLELQGLQAVDRPAGDADNPDDSNLSVADCGGSNASITITICI
jgi:hypothetical protein